MTTDVDRQILAALSAGERVKAREHDDSMKGRIDDGDWIRLHPLLDHSTLEVEDIVLTCPRRAPGWLHNDAANCSIYR